MDEDIPLDPQPPVPVSVPVPEPPAAESKQKKARRFGSGLAIGVGAGVGGVLVILAVVGLIVYLVLVNPWIDAVKDNGPNESGSIQTVQLDGKWLTMTDSAHGTVIGWSAGDMGSGSYATGAAFADFTLSMPTEQEGVPAMVSIDVLVTEQTQLLMGGQPWRPSEAGNPSPIHSVFGEMDDGSGAEPGFDYLNSRQLTVKFKRDGNNVIAESIDASSTQSEPPYSWIHGF